MQQTKQIKIVADLNIVPFNRPRFGGSAHHCYNSQRYSTFKEQLGMIAKVQMQGREPINTAFKISVDFFKVSKASLLTKTFGDIDNFLKSVLDALNGICYTDDSLCVEVERVRKFKSNNPKIIIGISY